MLIKSIALYCIPALILSACSNNTEPQKELEFTSHLMWYDVDDDSFGYGQTTLIDMDKDGDLDFVAGSNRTVHWLEYQSASSWIFHPIADTADTDAGGVAYDINGDGWTDHAAGSLWYLNPGQEPQENFAVKINDCMFRSHDMRVGDINGDGQLDLVAQSDAFGVKWCEYPGNPDGPWTIHVVDSIRDVYHAGIALGDIDGDGDLDISLIDKWFQNTTGNGLNWVSHPIGDFGKPGLYGLGTVSHILDLDGDGDNDIISSESEMDTGRVAWFENLAGSGLIWSMHIIKDSSDYQGWHSMCVKDFNNDGLFDVYASGGPSVDLENVKHYIWIHTPGESGDIQWEEKLIFSAIESHEARCGDVDGDGDIDIVTKGWEGSSHYYFENLIN